MDFQFPGFSDYLEMAEALSSRPSPFIGIFNLDEVLRSAKFAPMLPLDSLENNSGSNIAHGDFLL